MKPSVTIMSVADVALFQTNAGRDGGMAVKQFPLETGVPGVEMEFSWNAYDKGYGTPRHQHNFDQFRFALEGDREITWLGGETAERGTYMWVQAGAEVGEIGAPSGGTFFVIELPMLADIAARQTSVREPQLV